MPKNITYIHISFWSEWFMGKKWEQTTIHAHFSCHISILHLICLAETKQAFRVSIQWCFDGTANPHASLPGYNKLSLHFLYFYLNKNTVWPFPKVQLVLFVKHSGIIVWGWWDYSPNKAAHLVWSVPHQVLWWLQCCRLSLWDIISCLATPF